MIMVHVENQYLTADPVARALAARLAEPDGPEVVIVTPKACEGALETAVMDVGRARFVRLEKSRSRPGSGLGLSLVAAVARLHGGSVRLEDNGPGLRAVLSLPANGTRPVSAARATLSRTSDWGQP